MWMWTLFVAPSRPCPDSPVRGPLLHGLSFSPYYQNSKCDLRVNTQRSNSVNGCAGLVTQDCGPGSFYSDLVFLILIPREGMPSIQNIHASEQS